METPLWVPPPEKDLAAAKHVFVDLYGSVQVMNNYLKLAVLSLSGVIAGLIVLQIRTLQATRDIKPLVIRINDVGHAEAINYTSLEYKPREPELKYFLTQFVVLHYSRVRATVRENYARSLYFLDGELADAIIDANKKSSAIETFLVNGGDEVEVAIKNIVLEDLRTPPYRATVDFEKVYYAPDRSIARREKYVGNFVFVVKDRVPNAMIPINPLGLTITYFREDQAF